MHSTICDKLVFIASDETENDINTDSTTNTAQYARKKEVKSKNQVPYGCGEIIGQYTLTNITKFTYDVTDELNGFLAMDSPSPSVINAVWCANPQKEELQQIIEQSKKDEEKCEEIEARPTPLTYLYNNKKYDFVQSVLAGDD